MEKKTIGAFIAVLRKANGLTQRQLAEQLNVSDKAISRWERDEALPDLTLIPVLADIFRVTADELLRGQRNVNDTPPPQAEEKSKKQLKYLLDKAKTDYQIRTLVAVLVAVLGLILGAILFFEFGRPTAGFWVAFAFFAVAATLQTIFFLQGNARLNARDFDPATLADCKSALLRYTLLSYFLSIELFLFVLPVELFLLMDYANLFVRDVLLMGLIFSAIGAVVFGLLFSYIYYKRAHPAKHSAKSRLRLRTAIVVVALILLSVLAQGCCSRILQNNLHWFGTATVCDSIEAFLTLIETPPEGWHFSHEAESNRETIRIYEDAEGNWIVAYPDSFPWQGEEITYYHVNQDITHVTLRTKRLYTFTDEQYAAADRAYGVAMVLTLLLYPIEIAAAVLIYRKKAQRLLLG